MSAPTVTLHPRARSAAGLQLHRLPAGAIVEMPDGRRLAVQPGGELDPVVQGGRPHGGIAESASAGRAP